MKVLVTGGAGFIGSAIVSELVTSGHEVTVFDIVKGKENSEQVQYYEGNIFDGERLGQLLDGCDCVIHMVGLADARLAQSNPGLSYDLNIRSNQVLLEELRKNNKVRAIIPSSASIYGTTGQVPIPEQTRPSPTNAYSYHKLIGEQLAECYARNYGLGITILRLFNVYGPKGKGIVNILIENARKGEVTNLFGEDQLRDFVHISDIAKAFSGVLEEPSLEGFNIFNIGSGTGLSIENIVNLVKEYLPELKVTYGQFEGVRYDSIADISRIKAAIQFKPMDCEAAIRNTIEEIVHGRKINA